MNITNLPPEIWIILINYLDTKSKVNLYNTSNKIRCFFKPSNLKRIRLARSTLASVHSLKHDLFVYEAKFVLELNLSGVPDITADAFQPYVKKFENLLTLDVTFTNIDLSDLDKICPKTLRNIKINFFKCGRECYMLSEKWNCAKQVFIEQQFINVHFIVFDFMDTGYPLLFLNELPRIENLEVDIIELRSDIMEVDYDSFNDSEELTNMNFSRLRYLFRDCEGSNLQDQLQIDFEKVEYIFIMYDIYKEIVIYLSPIFKHLFPTNSVLTVKVEKVLPNITFKENNAIFHAWHKNTTIFDEKLFNSILQDLKDYFPIYSCMHTRTKKKILNFTTNWYCLDKCDGFHNIFETNPEKVTFTYNCRINNITLGRSVTLREFDEWDRIKNITFLRITDLYFGEDFFSNLFINCKRIVTLDIANENPYSVQDYMISFSNAVDHHANCLKNLKLTTECRDYNVLFNVLSKCPSLENIHMIIYPDFFETEFDYIGINPANIYSLFENCKNLYSLFIEADSNTHTQYSTILYSTINEIVQRLQLFHLFVELNCWFRSINPFEDVFNPSPLRIID